MNETKREYGFKYRYNSLVLLQIVTTLVALILFIYLAITDNMVVAPYFTVSLSICFFVSGYRLYKKNRIVAQKVIFYIAGIILVIIALQDLLQ